MIGRNSIVKSAENFSEHNAKNRMKISYQYRENKKKRKDFTEL